MSLLDKLMQGARKYNVLDFGMLKFALLFVGILLGTYFAEFFAQYISFIWILAVVFYGYIVVSTLRKSFCNKDNSRK